MPDDIDAAVRNRVMQLAPEFENIVRNRMKIELMSESHVPNNGRIAGWIEDIGSAMTLKDVSYSGGVFKATAYLPHGNNEARASVIFNGNPGILDNSIDRSKPYVKPGEQTWDDEMTEQSVHVPAGTLPWVMPDEYVRGPLITGGSDHAMANVRKTSEDGILQMCRQVISDIVENQFTNMFDIKG